ncbi:MAG: FkbM family methyltransferase [Hyphomonadaceae bacterium]
MVEQASYELFCAGPHRTSKEYLFKAILTNDKAKEARVMARNIVQFPFALGRAPGLLELKIPIKRKGDIGIGLAHVGGADDLHERFDVRREIVPCDTLDNVLSRIKINALSMIKIDVEGGEHDVLRGGVETLKRYRPTVICETTIQSMKRFGDTVDGLRAFMSELGYTAKDLLTGKVLGPTEQATDTLFTVQ